MLIFSQDVLMTGQDESLAARWRRLKAAVEEVRAAVNDHDPTRVPDAVAVALDALYDLWERWRRAGGLSNSQADNLVAGNDAGETTAALVHARGAKTHLFVEFGDFTDTFSDTYFDHYGA
jgi:hypothetical protein